MPDTGSIRTCDTPRHREVNMRTREILCRWYEKAQIDYAQLYMALYAAFNTWYRVRTRTENDRQAINSLREDESVWSCYRLDAGINKMNSLMPLLVELTQREPISYASPHWKGVVSHNQDWPSLLEYWYRVRCLVMHGAEIKPVYIYLAYETLNVFMGEMVKSIQD